MAVIHLESVRPQMRTIIAVYHREISVYSLLQKSNTKI